MEYEFLYSDSNNKNTSSKQNTKLNKEKVIRNKTNNNKSNNKNYKNKKYYLNTYNKSVIKDKNISFNLPKKKIMSIKSKLNKNKDKDEKSLTDNKIKRNLSQKKNIRNFFKKYERAPN